MATSTATHSPRQKLIEFLKRDLKALKRLMPEHERAEVPALLDELERMGNARCINFATATAEATAQEVEA